MPPAREWRSPAGRRFKARLWAACPASSLRGRVLAWVLRELFWGKRRRGERGRESRPDLRLGWARQPCADPRPPPHPSHTAALLPSGPLPAFCRVRDKMQQAAAAASGAGLRGLSLDRSRWAPTLAEAALLWARSWVLDERWGRTLAAVHQGSLEGPSGMSRRTGQEPQPPSEPLGFCSRHSQKRLQTPSGVTSGQASTAALQPGGEGRAEGPGAEDEP